ncbi:MAG: aldo/keto reductase [Bacteroidota bacterium]
MQNQLSKKYNSDIAFSPIIIGTMRLGNWGSNLSTDELEKFIDACLELGFKDFDHADIYGHYTEEERFGQVIKRRPDLKSKIQITTKCGIRIVTPNRPQHHIKSYDATAEHIIWSAENSLKQLGVDCLDVMLIHRPDYLMDPHEVAEAFHQLENDGKVKAFGVSNFSPSQFETLNSFFPLLTNQVEISLLHRNAFEDGTLDQCLRLGIRPTAWSPFGGGRIFTDTTSPEIQKIKAVIDQLGETHKASSDQILLAFLRKHPSGILPIIGSSKITRIQSAHQALDIKLSHEEWYRLWEAAIGEEVA